MKEWKKEKGKEERKEREERKQEEERTAKRKDKEKYIEERKKKHADGQKRLQINGSKNQWQSVATGCTYKSKGYTGEVTYSDLCVRVVLTSVLSCENVKDAR